MTEPDQPLRLLDWDSQFFGLRIAQVPPPSSSAQARSFVAAARTKSIDCLFCLVPAAIVSTQWMLEDAGFVARDLRLEFERSVPEQSQPRSQQTRRWADRDVEPLAQLASTSYPATRFACDPHISREAASRLYSTWFRNSCRGFADEVLVVGTAESPTGFITLHSDHMAGCAQIGLIAVNPGAQGTGAGRALVAGGLDWARAAGHRTVRVVTQGNNVAAQRLWQRCGFVTRSAHLWYHAWPDRPTNRREDDQ
jgi:dTDP-4-amino-4,6-dideoxy-D-galactose acyltransferase